MKPPFFLWRIFIKITGLWYAAELRARYTIFTLRLTARIALTWLRYRLQVALGRLYLSNASRTHQTELVATESVRPVRLYFYETNEVMAEGPAAVVRFTAYDIYGVAMAVSQLSYEHDTQGLGELERDVMVALENNVDVVIYSDLEPTEFPIVAAYLEP